MTLDDQLRDRLVTAAAVIDCIERRRQGQIGGQMRGQAGPVLCGPRGASWPGVARGRYPGGERQSDSGSVTAAPCEGRGRLRRPGGRASPSSRAHRRRGRGGKGEAAGHRIPARAPRCGCRGDGCEQANGRAREAHAAEDRNGHGEETLVPDAGPGHFHRRRGRSGHQGGRDAGHRRSHENAERAQGGARRQGEAARRPDRATVWP